MDVKYYCVPACKTCTESGKCEKLIPAKPQRKPRDPHSGSVQLPCGCWGLPWPLIHQLGTAFDEILCDTHGWLKITHAVRRKMKSDANVLKRESEAAKRRGGNKEWPDSSLPF